jgi:exonuclease SbcD
MRIIHTSDWHIGRTLHGVSLAAAHATFFSWLADLARDVHPDAILVSGDVYDRAMPSVDSVGLLEDGLAQLTSLAPVVMTPGNHDSARRLGFGSRWFNNRLTVVSQVDQAVRPVAIPDTSGNTGMYVYALPYLDPDFVRHDLVEAGLVEDPPERSHEGVMTAMLGLIRSDLASRRSANSLRVPAVVMAHAFVAGGQPSDSERDIRVGGVEYVPAGVFRSDDPATQLDYVALGHLHGPQRIGNGDAGPVIRYSGSPLAFSFSAKDQRKSVAIIDFDESGSVSGQELVPTPVPRTLADVEGTLEEVLSDRFADKHDSWVRILVHGRTRPPNLLATLKAVFPELLQVQFIPEALPQTRHTAPQPGKNVDPLEICRSFIVEATGQEPDPAETRALRTAYETVQAGGR